MALSLNEGSYGLLMDPLNGVADIENRELRLASNYGFIEEPVRMIRAIRFAVRLGWQLEEKTKARYETAKAEGYISTLQGFHRGYEAEEIVYEEDPLRVIRALEQEGWLKRLVPGWGSAKVNVAEWEKLRDAQMQLQMQGIVADASAAQFPLLTAKMPTKDAKALKKSFPRKGFIAEIDALEGEAKRFAAELGSKQVAKPSQTWKLLMAARPEVVLWVAYSTKNAALQAKFQSFYKEWPQARQRIPYVQMQEMRIVPELAGFDELVEKLFFELMDGHLGTVEEMKTYLEPYSPPAPPPTVHPRRARATKKEAKASKARKKSETDDGLADDADGFAEAALLEADAAVADKQTTASTGAKTVKTTSVKVEPAKSGAAKLMEKKATAPVKSVAPTKAVDKKSSAAKGPVKKAVSPAKQVASAKTNKKAVPVKKTAPAKPLVKKPVPPKVSGKVAAKKVVAKKIAAKKVLIKKVVAKKAPVKVKTKVAAKPAGKKVPSKNATSSGKKTVKQAPKGSKKK